MKKLHISMAGKRAVNGYLFILPWLLGLAGLAGWVAWLAGWLGWFG